jgi:hypothetical protein
LHVNSNGQFFFNGETTGTSPPIGHTPTVMNHARVDSNSDGLVLVMSWC